MKILSGSSPKSCGRSRHGIRRRSQGLTLSHYIVVIYPQAVRNVLAAICRYAGHPGCNAAELGTKPGDDGARNYRAHAYLAPRLKLRFERFAAARPNTIGKQGFRPGWRAQPLLLIRQVPVRYTMMLPPFACRVCPVSAWLELVAAYTITSATSAG